MAAESPHAWEKIAEDASHEEDPAKVLELCRKLTDAIDQEIDEEKKAKQSQARKSPARKSPDESSKDELPKTAT